MSGEPGIDEGTRTWAERPGVRKMLAYARRRAEQGRLGPTGVLGADLDDAERRDVAVLLGPTWQISGRRVPIGLLRKSLGRRGVTLEELLVAVGGPIHDRAADRADAVLRRRREEERARATLRGAIQRRISRGGAGCAGGTDELLDAVSTAVLPAAGAGARELRAEQLARVLDVLGDRDGVFLAVLAAEAFGDAHALDQSTPLGRAAARFMGLLGAEQLQEVRTTEDWRAAWAGVGVACDRVSSTVLVLNLPLRGTSALAALSGLRGEPVWLTARMVAAGVEVPAGLGPVFVCENPSVIESAADRLGVRSRPLICTYGRPSLAALSLLRSLHDAGVQVHVSTDHDRGGELVRGAVRTACPGARDWVVSAGGTYEEERLAGMLQDLRES